MWTPSRRTLYNWIKARKISVVQSQRETRITEEGLEQVRALMQKQRQKNALKEYYIALGKAKQNKDPMGAAKKRLQRHCKRGESPEDIAKLLLSQKRGRET